MHKLKGNKSPIDLYRKLMSYKSLDELQHEQLIKFKALFSFAKENVPYYTMLFESLDANVHDFKSLEDIGNLPTLSKSEIVDNIHLFSPKNYLEPYVWGSTGGSTGSSLRYRISSTAQVYNTAIQMRGFGYAGYRPYDRILTLAGGSLIKSNQRSTYKVINDYLHNRRAVSSYGMDEKDMNDFVQYFNRYKPQYLRGYATSLYMIAQYIQDSKVHLKHLPNAVFSTAEMLLDSQRTVIENTFGCRVFNQYGLNDGGITAFEDDKHNGFLVDTERGLLEVVDEKNKSVYDQPGEVIATSLLNYAFPFIRYRTGDIGSVTKSLSSKNSPRLRLVNLKGRKTDILIINDRKVGSPVLTVLMGKVDVLKYQFVQKNDVVILIMKVGDSYSHKDEDFIRDSLFSNLGSFELKFDYSGNFIKSNNKHNFIIKE